MNAPLPPSTSLSQRATPAEVLAAIHAGCARAHLDGEADYVGAVDALIALCLVRGACFSSGEIAAWLRTYSPDIAFNADRDIGAQVRGRFSAGMSPYASGPVQQISRYTQGYSRTSRGHLVYVYAPSPEDGQAHPFEVTAPPAGGAAPDPSDLPPLPCQPAMPLPSRRAPTPARRRRPSSAPAAAPAVTAAAARAASLASVHANRRLCVPRRAFEALSAAMSTPIPGGTPIYVSREGDTLHISLTPAAEARQYALVTSRRRLLLPSGLVPHSRYAIEFTPHGMTLDLAAPL